MPQPTQSDLHINAILTNISVAYMQEAKNFIAGQVFPDVLVSKESNTYFTYDKKDWFRDEAQERAGGTESAGGGYSVSTDNYNCRRYAMHRDVDDRTRASADIPINLDREATLWITQKLLLKKEKLWSDKFFKIGLWDEDFTPNNLWDTDNGDPAKDIRDKINQIASLTGFRPNVLVISPHVLAAIENNAKIKDVFKYTSSNVITEDILAKMFKVDKVLVPYGVINTAAEGATEATDFIYGKHALLIYAAKTPGIMTPSAGYTFVNTGMYGAGSNGFRIKNFRMEPIESDRIEGEIYLDQKLIAPDLGVFFESVVS